MHKMISSIVIVMWFLTADCYAQSPDPECDFSDHKPLVVSQLFPVIKKVQPKYPAMARAAQVEGKVMVKILVDRKGNVAEACVVEGHPLLRAAARAAVLEWKFQKNFGFSKKSKIKAKYLQLQPVFNFNLN